MSERSAEQATALAQQLETLQTALDACLACEQRYRRLFEATLGGYAVAEVVVDAGGTPVDLRLLEVNEAFGRLTGLTAEVTKGKTIRQLVPDIESYWIETLGKVALYGNPVRFERCINEFGSRWFEVFAYSPAPGQCIHTFFDITPRKQAEARLEEQLRFSQILLDAIPVPVFYKDFNGIYLGGNQAFSSYLGLPLEAIVGRTVYDISPRHLADVYRKADEELIGRGGAQTYETRVKYADGTEHDVAFYKATFSLDQSKGGLVGTIFDISDRKRMEQGLRESEARYRRQATELETFYLSAPVGLAVLDHELRYQRINERLARFNGKPVKAHIGKTIREVAPWIADTAEELGRRILNTGEAVRDFEFGSNPPGKPGAERFYVTHWFPLKDAAGRIWGINVVLEETTERKRLEERTRHMAQHDALTDLPNRRLLLELLDAELLKARRNGKSVALLFLDLDRFKTINDTLGHEAGDTLLKTVATRLLSLVRRSDVVARLGGDEFTVLLSDLAREEQAGEVAAVILRSFQRPFHLAEQTLYVATSIGISLYPNDGGTPEGLLRCADVAMYDAKEQGRNTVRFYNPVVDRHAHERIRIESRLRHALERGELSLCYQPEIDLRTGLTIGVEALVRWHHPELGLLDPARFIPVAEESDLIAALDDWVLRTACAQARVWLDQGCSLFYVGVNLSAKRFEGPNLVDTIRHYLTEEGLDPEHLELELTERTLMRHIDQTVDRMRELVDLGVGIAVDDFGTGYSSLSYLKRLPIAKLKIDQSFVRDIDTDADDRAIVQAVTNLGHTLNKRVIAEGVETEAQRDFLTAAGCDEAQGFLFKKPLPPEQLRELLLH